MPQTAELQIAPITSETREVAVALLARFFREEGFATPRDRIAANLAALLADPACWGALAAGEGGAPLGVVTVTTMLFVEWGRLGEIGDLYVVPECRGRGIGRALIAEALAWCRLKRCSAVAVTVTPEGEERHHLQHFYERLSFRRTGRASLSLDLAGDA